MSRAQKLARTVAFRREQLAKQKMAVRQAEAQQREEERKAHARRCYVLGRAVLASPLGQLDDTPLLRVLALLAPVAAAPDPVAYLEALLSQAGSGSQGPQGDADQVAPLPPPCTKLLVQ